MDNTFNLNAFGISQNSKFKVSSETQGKHRVNCEFL